MKTSKITAVKAVAQSLFARLKSEHGADRAKKMVRMILENAELRQKVQQDLYSSTLQK